MHISRIEGVRSERAQAPFWLCFGREMFPKIQNVVKTCIQKQEKFEKLNYIK